MTDPRDDAHPQPRQDPDPGTAHESLDTRTVAEVVRELAEMVHESRTSPTITQRLIGRSLVVAYEFTRTDGEVSPYVMRVGAGRWGIEPGSIDPAEADIVIRTSPDTLLRLTSGALGGREAIVSGLLDIRKAPAMPKLLVMRALFNQHRKSRQRARAVSDDIIAPAAAGDDAPVRP